MKPKRLLQLFVLTTLLFSAIGNSRQFAHASADSIYQAGPSVTTSVNPTSISFGGTALVNVSLNNVPGAGYSSAEFTCTYDPNLLEASNVAVAGLFGMDAITAVSGPQNGKLIFAIAGSKGHKATTSGTAFTFNVKGLYVGLTAINCTARVSRGDNILISLPSIGTSFSVNGGVPSPEPFTPTAIPTSACDKAQFIGDITVPPGTVMSPGAIFRKTWRLMNVGTCTWTSSYQLIFYSGVYMGPSTSIPFSLPGNVQTGQTVDISINMTAPFWTGSQRGYWMFRNANGALFGIGPNGNEPWFVDINVTGPTSTFLAPTLSPTPTGTPGVPANSPTPSITPGGPTAPPSPGAAFDFAANACFASWSSGAGQLLCPGIDGDAKGFMLKLDHPTLENGTIDSRPSLLTVPQNIYNGYIQGVYPPFRVQSGDRFRSTIGCEGGATNCYVVFRLDYQIGSGPINNFWAFVEKYDGQPYNADIDLSRLAGEDVKFILTVQSIGSPLGDRALWVNPIIYRANTTPTSTLSPTTTSTSSSTMTPIITPTTTPTEMPRLTLRGQVLASKPVTINLYDAVGTQIASVTADSDGVFNLATPNGTYIMVVTASGFLTARGSVILTPEYISTLSTVSLPAGDLDNNDVIDQFDALTIGINYNSPLPTAADLNNDGIIDLFDLELLAINYHKVGPIVWQ